MSAAPLVHISHLSSESAPVMRVTYVDILQGHVYVTPFYLQEHCFQR